MVCVNKGQSITLYMKRLSHFYPVIFWSFNFDIINFITKRILSMFFNRFKFRFKLQLAIRCQSSESQFFLSHFVIFDLKLMIRFLSYLQNKPGFMLAALIWFGTNVCLLIICIFSYISHYHGDIHRPTKMETYFTVAIGT